VPARLDDPRSDGVEICAGIAAIGWQYYEGRSLTVDVQLDLDAAFFRENPRFGLVAMAFLLFAKDC
jgi:hypothetical protein